MGEDTIVYVPCGTIIYDAITNEGLADLWNRATASSPPGAEGAAEATHFFKLFEKGPEVL